MFITHIRGGKAFAAEQKTRKFKKLLFKIYKVQKKLSTKRIDTKKLIQKATNNLNSITSAKYSNPLEEIKVKSLKDNRFREIYDFYRSVNVKQILKESKDKFSKRRLREPLVVGEKVLVLAARLKKKDASKNLHKPTTENIIFFNRDRKFIIKKL